jgi:hypothetical protein
MRWAPALQGIVMDTTSDILTIRLDSGAVVKAKGPFKLGDRCWVLYDYTIMKVRQIRSIYELMASGPREEIGPPISTYTDDGETLGDSAIFLPTEP